tara:strand:+ start:824 stop:991 length:168 start_codon:yes stop_codon:yes gene_type:complete
MLRNIILCTTENTKFIQKNQKLREENRGLKKKLKEYEELIQSLKEENIVLKWTRK